MEPCPATASTCEAPPAPRATAAAASVGCAQAPSRLPVGWEAGAARGACGHPGPGPAQRRVATAWTAGAASAPRRAPGPHRCPEDLLPQSGGLRVRKVGSLFLLQLQQGVTRCSPASLQPWESAAGGVGCVPRSLLTSSPQNPKGMTWSGL